MKFINLDNLLIFSCILDSFLLMFDTCLLVHRAIRYFQEFLFELLEIQGGPFLSILLVNYFIKINPQHLIQLTFSIDSLLHNLS